MRSPAAADTEVTTGAGRGPDDACTNVSRRSAARCVVADGGLFAFGSAAGTVHVHDSRRPGAALAPPRCLHFLFNLHTPYVPLHPSIPPSSPPYTPYTPYTPLHHSSQPRALRHTLKSKSINLTPSQARALGLRQLHRDGHAAASCGDRGRRLRHRCHSPPPVRVVCGHLSLYPAWRPLSGIRPLAPDGRVRGHRCARVGRGVGRGVRSIPHP
jgi:hypothetical protein